MITTVLRNQPPSTFTMTATGSWWIFDPQGGYSYVLDLESSPSPGKWLEMMRHSWIPHKLPFSSCGKLNDRDYTTLVHHLERTNPFSTCPFSMTSPMMLLLPARNASSFLNLLNGFKDFSSCTLMLFGRWMSFIDWKWFLRCLQLHCERNSDSF